MGQYTAKKMIIDMTQFICDLNDYDIKSVKLAIDLKNKRNMMESMGTYDPNLLTELFNLYIKYSDDSEVLNKKIERICQLFITNPNVVSSCREITSMGMVDETLRKCNDILYQVSLRRMHSLEMRTWIVQQQMKKAWRGI